MRLRLKLKHILIAVVVLHLGYFTYNAVVIYRYSFTYTEAKSDIAIILGYATEGNTLNSVFKNRIDQGIYLYQNSRVKQLLFTGGKGGAQQLAESELAKAYAIRKGIPEEAILTERKSRNTIENLQEAREIMDSLELQSALLVSSPLHMKRAMSIAEKQGITCKASPTRKGESLPLLVKAEALVYESFFYSLGKLTRSM